MGKTTKYERTGDHSHGGRPLKPGAPCGTGTDCWVRRVREALAALDS